MNRLRTLIVDDEELARRGLRIRLQRCEDIEICGEARNGREALAAIRKMHPDVVLLDIQMPGMGGFDVLEQLAGSEMPSVIFVTAYDKFAIRAFEASALDYLLKPIDDERLEEALARARARQEERRAAAHRDRLLRLICDISGMDLSLDAALTAEQAGVHRYPGRLAVRDGSETRFVPVGEIDWIDAAGDYMCLHVSGETLIMRGTMKSLEEILNPADFIRIHRSAIVNRSSVSSLEPHRNGEYFVRLTCGETLKLSRGYKENLSRLSASG